MFIFLGCNNGTKNIAPNKEAASTDSLINNADAYADSANREAASIIAANDCLTCHRINEKSVGPSYMEIAAKYHYNQGNIENLIHSIINGSVGIWGNEKKMTPHPNLTFNDAEKMVKYILTLKDTASAK